MDILIILRGLETSSCTSGCLWSSWPPWIGHPFCRFGCSSPTCTYIYILDFSKTHLMMYDVNNIYTNASKRTRILLNQSVTFDFCWISSCNKISIYNNINNNNNNMKYIQLFTNTIICKTSLNEYSTHTHTHTHMHTHICTL